jgi:hypothetical protein
MSGSFLPGRPQFIAALLQNARVRIAAGSQLRGSGGLLGYDAAQHFLIAFARFLVILDQPFVLVDEVTHHGRGRRAEWRAPKRAPNE